MITPKIKDYFSTDLAVIDETVFSWSPEDPTNVYLAMDLYIGDAQTESADIFQVVIATPAGLSENFKYFEIIDGRFHIIVPSYDWAQIREHFEKTVKKCAAVDWSETAANLSRHFAWEYEDLQEE